MDQPSADKFNELAPVLELMYVVMTHMTRYLDVYAKDIDATKLEEFKAAKAAMQEAINKFNAFFGVESGELAVDEGEEEVEGSPVVEEIKESVAPVAPAQEKVMTPEEEDQESLKKAKEAVDELKALFADMKEKEEAEMKAEPQMEQPAQDVVASDPSMNNQHVTPPPAPQAPPVNLPTPESTQAQMQQGKDASEIDNILEELRKLQNKGGQL